MVDPPEELGALLKAWGITGPAAALYVTALRLREAGQQELADTLGLDPAELSAGLRALSAAGLVAVRGVRVSAVEPAAALDRLVTIRLEELAATGRRLTLLRDTIEELAPHYEAGRAVGAGRLPIELVRGLDELMERVAEMHRRTPRLDLVLSVSSDRLTRDAVLSRTGFWEERLRAGTMSVRSIIPVDALTEPAGAELIRRLDRSGVRFRTLPRVPDWVCVLGRDAVAVPVSWGHPVTERPHGCYLVRAPAVAEPVRNLLDALWEYALPLPWDAGDDQRMLVLRLLALGLTDESIARHLRVSVRTVRSRIAAAMAELGARTRFQAGAEAARRGWL